MKRLFILMILSLVIAGSLFAATDKTLNENPYVEWEFKPEVSTYAGYNLDSGGVGLIGKAKLSLTSKLFDKANVEFSEEAKPYGYIKIEDLEIKVSAETKDGSGSNSEKHESGKDDVPLTISWGTISGTIYAGPVYFKLAHDGHGNQGFIKKGLDDGDLDYSVINYSVLSALNTAEYVGYRKKPEAERSTFSSEVMKFRVFDIDDNTQGGKDPLATKLADSNNSFSVGFKDDALLDVRVGVAAAGGYKHIYRNNPIQLSFFLDLLAIKNFVLKAQATAIAGVHPSGQTGVPHSIHTDEGGFLTEGNPLTIGLLFGYELPIGTNNLTSTIGVEVSMENKVDKYGELSVPSVPLSDPKREASGTNSADDSETENRLSTLEGKDTTVDIMAYQVALGVKYDWKSLGRDADEDGHLSINDDDFKVTDGVSLGLLYGAAPHAIIRAFTTNYMGVKLALWDSQADDKPGILPVKLALVANFNYMFGGEYEAKDFGAEAVVKNPKFVFGARQDAGLLLETSIKLGYIKPFLKTGVRMYNLGGAKEIEIKLDGKSYFELQDILDKTDLRVKLGVDIVDIVKNVEFNVWWESGNILKKDDVVKSNYNKNSSFYSFKDNINKQNEAKLGFIAFGAKISY